MKSQLLQRPLDALAHPISIGAAIILLLNAVVWQRMWPSWWTGKIGDFAWLVIAPLWIAAFLRLGWPGIFDNDHLTSQSAIVIAGAGYALLKSIPAFNALVVTWLSQFGFTPKLLVDPSDLIALPALLVAGWVWNRPRRVSVAPWSRLGALLLTALALIADSSAPLQLGVVCLAEREDGIYAFAQEESHPYFHRGPDRYWTAIYASPDGGSTWTRSQVSTQEESHQKVECGQIAWPLDLETVNHPPSQLFFVMDQGIYLSTDSGETLHLEQKMPSISSALVHTATGNLIVATGGKVYMRTQAGDWSEISLPSK